MKMIGWGKQDYQFTWNKKIPEWLRQLGIFQNFPVNWKKYLNVFYVAKISHSAWSEERSSDPDKQYKYDVRGKRFDRTGHLKR